MSTARRIFLKKLATTIFVTSLSPSKTIFASKNNTKNTPGKLSKFKKIDIHTHISSDAQYLREVMNKWNFKMFTICNEGLKSERLEAQKEAAIEISHRFPRYYGWCTTFNLNDINNSEWGNKVIRELRNDFDQGALAVKVWKDIGMQLKDANGDYIQIDNPVFEPVIQFISENSKTLFMHIGDPPDYWLTSGEDGMADAWYKEDGGVWNRIGMFRGEVSYESLMHSRDNILSKHPDLRVVGCHMGNMSFDVDQIAIRLDNYPNYAVETSFTLSYLMRQDRGKVRKFFIKYQDRILYGSDISGGLVASPFLVDMSKIDERWTEEEIKTFKIDLLDKYEKEYNYFSTDQEFTHQGTKVKGLALPEEVLYKLYYENSVSWIPGIDSGF